MHEHPQYLNVNQKTKSTFGLYSIWVHFSLELKNYITGSQSNESPFGEGFNHVSGSQTIFLRS